MDTKKLAFIDVQNTDTTTKKLLGFEVDWKKLCQFLKNDWQCEKIFFYVGIDDGDLETTNIFEGLHEDGGITRAKVVFAYKNRNKDVSVTCPKCNQVFIEKVDMGYNRKSNCDVDLTVDVMELSGPDKEFYIFSGDGDFEFLIRKVNEKGTKVHVVSSAKKIKSGPRYFTSRFSTKLRKVISGNPKMVDFSNIDNIRYKIEKK